MNQKLHVVKATIYKTGKDGKPLEGKFGPYYKLNLQTLEYPNEVLSAFIKPGSPQENVKENDEINAVVDNNAQTFGGRLYRNFKFAKPEDLLTIRIEDLEKRVTALERNGGSKTEELDLDNLTAEDLPF